MSVRVRFAPSPTGMLHVGALRTVLFDHFLARKHGGQNILRIEDTDRTRYNADSEREFIETLHQVGIDFQEGPHVGGPHAPYRQSERKAAGIYAHWIQVLLDSGHAYKAFDTPEDQEEMREYQKINKLPQGYFGGSWRDATSVQVAEAEGAGKPFVVRQRMPRDRKIVTQDALRGRVEVDSNLLNDTVLIKADGMPTYHFAAIVDDHLMEISHVLRGDEWLPSFPIHWLLYEQFGWTPPVYVHCAVIVGKDGKKLSKRHGATRVLDYGAQGFGMGALKNFIALIGWSPGDDREVMTEPQLIEAFSLDGLQTSPGRFDLDKLRWLNGVQIRQLSPEVLLETLLDYARNPYTEAYWSTLQDEDQPADRPLVNGRQMVARLKRIVDSAHQDRTYLLAAVKEAQSRVETLADFGEALEFFLVDEVEFDPKAVEKWLKGPDVLELFDWISSKLAASRVETVEHYDAMIRGFQTHKGYDKLGPVVHPTRVALTGKTTGPGLFELMAVLGHDRIERRLARARTLL